MNKRIKKLLCFFLSSALMFSAVTVYGLQTDNTEEQRKISYNDKYIYEVNDDETVSILFYIGDESEVVVPAELDSMPVVEIKDRAFYESGAKQVVISDGIKKIGDEVFFDCDTLSRVTLPDSIEHIGTGVFRNCAFLYRVNFEGDDFTLGKYMFYGCQRLKWVTLSANTLEIPEGAFSYCSSLTYIDLPAGLESISSYAFYRSGLISVILPESIDFVGEKAFAQSEKLGTFVCMNSQADIAENALEGCDSYGSALDPTEPTLPAPSTPDNGTLDEITPNPTNAPGITPTDSPTDAPTDAPTEAPTAAPTGDPCVPPIEAPTDAPEAPTDHPVVDTEPTDEVTTEEFDITKDGYCIGTKSAKDIYEINYSYVSRIDVKNTKKELLLLAWNVRTVGDANKDGQVNIKDATAIQRYIAELVSENSKDFDYKNSDVDTDGKVTVKDATTIQKFIAGILISLC